MFTASKTIDIIELNIVYRIFEFIKGKKLLHLESVYKYCLSNLRIHNARYTDNKAKFKVEIVESFTKPEHIFLLTFCQNIY